jgi:hypothetical protein
MRWQEALVVVAAAIINSASFKGIVSQDFDVLF